MFDQKLIDEYARAQVAKQQYLDKGRKDLADNADRYRNQVSQKLASQGFKIDSNADLSGDYIKKHGDGAAGKYDTSQKGQVVKGRSDNAQGNEPASAVDRYTRAMANGSLKKLNPIAEASYKDDNGRDRVRLLPMLRHLTEGRQSEIDNQQVERDFGFKQGQQEWDNRFDEKKYNTDLAQGLSERYGIEVAPKSDYQYLMEQVKGLKPIEIQKMEADERERQSLERNREQGIAVDWARIGDSRAERSANKTQQASEDKQRQLMDIWEITGIAPEGINGVAPGTPIYQKPSGGTDHAYDEAMLKAIDLASRADVNNEADRAALVQQYYRQLKGNGPVTDDDINEYLRR